MGNNCRHSHIGLGIFSDSRGSEDAQKQLDSLATQIALAGQQNQLFVKQATLAAEQSKIQIQLLSQPSPDTNTLSLTATAFFIQLAEIESTKQAIATEQRNIELAQTAQAATLEILSAPLVINGTSYTLPNPQSAFFCIARSVHTNGSNDVRYDLIVPKGWVMAWDSFKAYWPNGGYDTNGLLVIFGPWEGQIRVNTGGSCSGPIEWLDQIIDNRCADYPNVPSRRAYTINMPSNFYVRDCN